MKTFLKSFNYDLVYELFMLLAEVEPPKYAALFDYDRLCTLSTFGWVRLTHVCRFWRYVGLEIPSLWARIVSIIPSAAPAFLDRARHAPLTITSNFGGFSLALLEGKMERLKFVDISIDHDPPTYADWPSALCSGKEIPHLRFLTLKACKQERGRVWEAQFPLNATFLESLSLDTLFISVINAPCLRLLHLKLDSMRENSSISDQLLPLLQQVPLLQDFLLETAFSFHGNRTKCNEYCRMVMVHLPRLTRFRLSGYEAHIIQHMTMASNTSLDLSIRRTDIPPLNGLFNIISTHFLSAYDELSIGDGNNVTFRLCSSDFSIPSSLSYHDNLCWMMETTVSDMLQHLRPAQIRSLSCNFHYNWALKAPLPDGHQATIFRDLRTLLLDFENCRTVTSLGVFKAKWEHVVNLLASRASAGCPVDTLGLVATKQKSESFSLKEDFRNAEQDAISRAQNFVAKVVDQRAWA
jgi:hypothetical protein